MPYTRERLGELLVSAEAITEDQLAEALERKRTEGGKLGEVLVRMLALTEEQLAETLAKQKGLLHVTLTSYPVDRAVVSLIPERLARRRGVIPIGFDEEDGMLLLAMADPLDIEALDDARLRTGYDVKPVVTTVSEIRYALEKFAPPTEMVLDASYTEEEETSLDDEVLAGEDVPIVRLVNQLIKEAVADGASDIHIEPEEREVRVRYRVDGVMQEVVRLPASSRAGVVSRVKIMADMNIAERRRPQDGKIIVHIEGRPVDLRVASLPTPHGEALTIRLLNTELTFHELETLGLNPRQLGLMEAFIARPYGAVLISGPTGSGKSTTLYASLQLLNESSRKIITIEDPVEYQMQGVTQIAVNPKIGLTFAAGLRTVLRSDPDVVMVGEIRDPETAVIAMRAALTGHLVLSSIHTNDAPSALARLVDMDVAPYIASSALVGVIAQRLARKLCEHCKKPVKVTKDVLLQAGFTAEDVKGLTVYGPVGCARCLDSGYKGRIGLFEFMTVDDEVRKLFLKSAPTDEVRKAALSAGMISLRRDALDKVAAGITSLDEIERVVV